MDKQVIISIGRECGSGGRIVAEFIGDKLGIPVLDKNVLDEVHEETKIDKKTLTKYDEKAKFFGRILKSKSNEVTQAIWDLIKKKADNGESFVIVGRCSEMVLKDNRNALTVFVTGDRYDKFARIVDAYGFTEAEAEELRARTDEERAKYHNRNTDTIWGDPLNYDLVVNTSTMGVEAAAEAIMQAAVAKAEIKPEVEFTEDDAIRKEQYLRRVAAGF